ncbi:hypothetical protein M1N54_03625 [Thermodesulfovibrionales bacterium]|nr:hypothetical protein [Thermodesulfovibrionales bacterium]
MTQDSKTHDSNKRRPMFKDKTVLVTGGTGSFGSVVLRRFMSNVNG